MSDRELQHASEALYQYMCEHVVGMEETVKTRRLLIAIRDNLSYNKYLTIITSGSFGEGLEMKGSDFDYMFVLNDIKVHENQLDIQWKHSGTCFTVVTEDTKLGFVKLLLLYGQIDCDTNLCVEYKGQLYLSNQRMKSALKYAMGKFTKTDYHTEVNHGPCLSDKKGLFDFAICLHMRSWINDAKHWFLRTDSFWPSNDVKSSIIKHGVLFVPVGVKGSPNEEIEWRISFSVGEKLLINSFTHTQLLCYALMKICLKDIINQDKNCTDLLCSYFIKNIIFWVSEESPISIWKPCNPLSCFMRCFGRLIYCAEYSICPHYFIPENNMFENKIEGRSRDLLLEKLNALYDQDWKFILYSPQLQDFFRIPFIRYTESQLLINYVEQINLSAVYLPSFPSKDITFYHLIKECSSYISPKIKSYYRYYLSMYSQQKAGAISLDAEKDNNKQMYKDYIQSQSYLLKGIHHDVVTGWLLLASLFYKIKRYRKALGILHYALSKCSRETISEKTKLSFVQRQLLNSNEFQSKGLVEIFRYIRLQKVFFNSASTLVPKELEQEISFTSHLIPPVVYAHFLSLLCYFHLRDAIQTRNSLEDLQLTVSEEYFICNSNCKSVSYNCLGIALQLIGETNLAKHAFHNAIALDDIGLFSCALMRLSIMDTE